MMMNAAHAKQSFQLEILFHDDASYHQGRYLKPASASNNTASKF